MEERSDRRLLHPAHPGADPRRRLQKASPSLQEEKRRQALGVSNIPAALSRSFTAWAGVGGTAPPLTASCFERADDVFFFSVRLVSGSRPAPKWNGWASLRRRPTRQPMVGTVVIISNTFTLKEPCFLKFTSRLFSRLISNFFLFVCFLLFGCSYSGHDGEKHLEWTCVRLRWADASQLLMTSN